MHVHHVYRLETSTIENIQLTSFDGKNQKTLIDGHGFKRQEH